MRTLHHRALAGIVFFSSVALLAGGGPLNPPAGAVTATAKPLAEVEPRTAINAANTPGTSNALFLITQPGSYYLTGNIAGVASKHGIQITASDVTIDLNGFELLGSATGFGDGILASGTLQTNLTVRNGSVSNWTVRGIAFGTASNCRITGVTARANTTAGISAGSGATVSDCVLQQNGLNAGNGCTIVNCSSVGVGAGSDDAGISGGSGCLITDCTASYNLIGINVGSGCIVTRCTAVGNTGNGISCTSTCVIRGNTCRENGDEINDAGITTGPIINGSGTRIEGNHCSGSPKGIRVSGSRNIIFRNTCADNTTQWDIAQGNICAPIQNHQGSNRPAVSGFGFGSDIGLFHDNFSY